MESKVREEHTFEKALVQLCGGNDRSAVCANVNDCRAKDSPLNVNLQRANHRDVVMINPPRVICVSSEMHQVQNVKNNSLRCKRRCRN